MYLVVFLIAASSNLAQLSTVIFVYHPTTPGQDVSQYVEGIHSCPQSWLLELRLGVGGTATAICCKTVSCRLLDFLLLSSCSECVAGTGCCCRVGRVSLIFCSRGVGFHCVAVCQLLHSGKTSFPHQILIQRPSTRLEHTSDPYICSFGPAAQDSYDCVESAQYPFFTTAFAAC